MVEDKMANSLIDKIVRLDSLKGQPQEYGNATKLIKELVNGFNSHELMKLVSFMVINFKASIYCFCAYLRGFALVGPT